LCAKKEWLLTRKIFFKCRYLAVKTPWGKNKKQKKTQKDYARGVYKIFDQETSRAEIISTVVNDTVPNTITCTWRLSGKVSIGPGLTIKPYIVYTDFTVDPGSGLITSQKKKKKKKKKKTNKK